MLQLDDLTKRYGAGETAVTALRSVTLEVVPGELVALYGPSGSGKTTLLQLAAGLTSPTSGSVRVGGVDLASLDEAARTRLRRTAIGFVFQLFNLVPALTAAENVALPLRFERVDRKAAAERAARALEAVGLGRRGDDFPSRMSGGEMQRVSLARALAAEPQLILADEPTGSLDTANGQRVLELLAALAAERGIAVLLASHDPRAADYATRVVALRDGVLSSAGAGGGGGGGGGAGSAARPAATPAAPATPATPAAPA